MRYELSTTDGGELIATSMQPVKNNAGTGYRVETEINGQGGGVIFYKTEEMATIMQVKE